jgi:hypothetical protein
MRVTYLQLVSNLDYHNQFVQQRDQLIPIGEMPQGHGL